MSLIFTDCTSKDEPVLNKRGITSEKDLTEYLATGTVISIPPGNRNIIIKHGKIPGFMDAMTMPFALKDSMQLAGISAKDSIRFKINNARNRIFISDIEKIENQ